MYEFFSKISNIISGPLFSVAQTDIAVLSALFLGFVGSVAPCQISANAAAAMFFGNRQVQARLRWVEILLYLLGKVAVFSVLGIIFFLFGRELSTDFIPLFSWSRKLLGPLLIIIGLFMLGLISLQVSLGTRLSQWLQGKSRRLGGKGGAFLLGAAFSLGFCPTMFVLFYGSLMPLSISAPYGFVFPTIFAVGTAMPFLLFVGLMVGFGLDQIVIHRTKKMGLLVQRFAGFLMFVLGIADTATYWITPF
ncbi:sulfite exporter TauE/SafE family protein [Paenibacillus antri]|uniref:Sulfite exporter TauE/SafE family protein n=1 Tax=Paenibacillus antri TaxID=2582848 RepID=A0A5R9G508_9BACL|nr:sulfite exporter TauE/SafE family protein [Paenibacillus antri]TLS50129.1 sulfite exporter TauE/SafE family protein [Paenibacillus antri]